MCIRDRHKIPLETYCAGLLQKVEWQIQEYEDTAADTLTLCRLCVDYLQEILGELKTFIISYPFASTEEEIHYPIKNDFNSKDKHIFVL